ncbi:MAG: glycerol-3-phosphate acyltransferase [Chloroflexi bacterium]|nr:glycerol-3-phosphate acyltransferase [Chloroflexota bacterium]MBI5292539.1 glycerol-3-phosphate acyltransferase [Chloroflexota bacterium]
MTIVVAVTALVVAYLLGAIPFGLVIVRRISGQDVRSVGSGRTGGTNVMRAAGFGAGLLTALLDILKGAGAVWLARTLTGGNHWIEALAGVVAVLGHNYSVFLAERVTDAAGRTRLRFHGGAGGAPSVGGAIGLWVWSVAVILPLGAVVLFGIGYASVATMSVGLVATLVFAVRAAYFGAPWEYVLFGLLTFVLQVWALRPNITRLMNGTERMIGWRAKRREARLAANSNSQSK